MIYTQLACTFFGGWISFDKVTELSALDGGIADQYVYLNFNDYASGYITFFAIMVNNNWQYIVYMYSFQAKSDIE